MARQKNPPQPAPTADRAAGLPKSPTGIRGLDEITEGGLPRGRPTLVPNSWCTARCSTTSPACS